MDQSLRKPVAREVVGGEMRRGRLFCRSAPGAGESGSCWRHVRLAGAGGVLLAGLAMVASAQEAVQMSMASAEAAAAQRKAASTIDYYNLKLGPTAWNFQAGLETDYNSNVNNTENNPEGDFIFRPQINTRMLWPLSDRNSINLALGAGYSA